MNFDDDENIRFLIEKARTTINYNKSLIVDDVAVAMLGIEHIAKLKKQNEEFEIFLKVLDELSQ